MNYLNDTDIIERLLEGDTEAFGLLVGRYSERVFSLVCRICGNREDAEEVTQDVFVKVFRNIGNFRRASSFSSWIYRIAYNASISHLRRQNPFRMSELQEERLDTGSREGPDDFEAAAPGREEQLERLEKALATLPPDDRALLLFFYREDKSVREIAEIVSQSENNIKTRLHRIRKRLGNIYNELS